MTEEEFAAYQLGRSDDQVASLRELRALVLELTTELDESVNEGKWLHGFIFYSHGGQMIFAAGSKGTTKTSFHMMPFYGSSVLQQKHAEALSPFLTGKSCIAFRRFDELPFDALVNIIERGSQVMKEMIAESATRARASN